MRLLFNTSTYFGDAVVSTGLLGHLIDRHPEARVTIACGRPAAPLFTGLPNLERLIPITKRKGHLHWLDIWLPSVTKRWDLVVDLKGSALPYLLPARQRLVFRPSHAQGGDRTTEWAQLLGLEALPAPRVWTGAQHEQNAERLLGGGGPLLAFGPTASWRPKMWPAERFAELAHRLTAASGPLPEARIVLIGAPGDEAKCAGLVEALPPGRVVNLFGKTDLLTAAAVLKRCDLFVGNDSGPLYLSVAVGLPGLGLMGPSPGLFGPAEPPYVAPWAKRTALVRTDTPLSDLVGAPGFDPKTSGNLMGSLTVDAAEAAVAELWQRCAAKRPQSGAANR